MAKNTDKVGQKRSYNCYQSRHLRHTERSAKGCPYDLRERPITNERFEVSADDDMKRYVSSSGPRNGTVA